MIKCYSCDEYITMEWADIVSQTVVSGWSGKVYTKYTPAGADSIVVNIDGTYTINVIDLRVLIDNLSNGGVSLNFKNIKVEPAYYLGDIQGYNSIILYKGWFCRVDSCGRVILCTEQVAYDKGLLAK